MRAPHVRRPLRPVAVTAAAAVAALVGGALSAPAAAAATPSASAPVRVIVQLTSAPSLERVAADTRAVLHSGTASARTARLGTLASARAAVRASQDALVAAAARRSITVHTLDRLSGVINAIVADVPSAEVDSLRAVPGVEAVTVDHRLSAYDDSTQLGTRAGAAATSRTAGATTSGSTGAATSGSASAGASASAITGARTAAASAASLTAAAALPGAGRTIAVIDTGVDYSLPDLGGCFGSGCKVAGGYDFVNDDADPADDNYHGTHVAGIIAGTGVDQVRGVAPGVTLTAWKVLDDRGSGYESTILQGLEAAVNPAGAHPADIVNMSLGGAGDGRDPLAAAANTAARGGVLVVAAAGNSGPTEGTVGTPALAASVLAVGATVTGYRAPSLTVTAPASVSLESWPVVFSAVAPAAAPSGRIIDLGTASPDEIAAAGDLHGAIVSYTGDAPRTLDGAGDAYETALRVQQTGAAAAIVRVQSPVDENAPGGGDGPVFFSGPDAATQASVVADAPHALTGTADQRLSSLVVLGVADGAYGALAEAVQAGTARVRIDSTDLDDTIASFSSRGPTPYGAVKPEIVAPGYSIRSLVPAWQGIEGNVYRLSGTSMASPYVAGVAALASITHPKLSATQLKALVVGSARTLDSAAAHSSALVQGAGAADPASAKAGHLIASSASIGLGQADASARAGITKKITLHNVGSVSVTASLAVDKSAGSTGTVTVSPSRISLKPNATTSITVTIKGLSATVDAELSGSVVAAMTNGRTLRIPFAQVVRHLQVVASPQPSTGGPVRVIVSSPLPLDAAPTLTITQPNGARLSVPTSASSSLAGSYAADVRLDTVGVNAIAATSTTSARAITGAGSVEVIPGTSASATTWQSLGRNGSGGSITVSTASPGTAELVVGDSARPFVTTDHGVTWRPTASLPVADGFGTLIGDDTDGDAFWYQLDGASGSIILDASYNARLFRTEDLGRTWSALPLPDIDVERIVGQGDRLVAATAGALETSTDGGATWSSQAVSWPEAIAGIAIVGDDVVVTGYGTTWKIDDAFTTAASAPRVVRTDDGIGVTSVAAQGDTLVMAGPSSLTRSTDGGETWTDEPRPEGWLDAAYTAGDGFVVSTLSGFLRSPDGAQWTAYDFPVHGPTMSGHGVAVWPDRAHSFLLGLDSGGLFSSDDDGSSFTRIGAAGLTAFDVQVASAADGTPVVLEGDTLGVGHTELPADAIVPTGTTEWGLSGTEGYIGVTATNVVADAGDASALTRIRLDANSLASLETSDDAGDSWASVGPRAFGESLSALVTSSTSGHQAAVYGTASDRGIIVTTDRWQHWSTYAHEFVARALLIDPSDEQRLWIAADDGLYRSDDGGRTATRVLAQSDLTSVWVDPLDPARVVAGGRGVWTSADGGRTFAAGDLGGDTLLSDIVSVVSPTGGPDILFAASRDFRPGDVRVGGRGVLASTNGGLTWTNVSAGLGVPYVTSLAASADGRWLLAGTSHGGVWRGDVRRIALLLL